MNKFHRFCFSILTVVLVSTGSEAFANQGGGFKFPFFKKSGVTESTRMSPVVRRLKELPRPKLACYPTSSYVARFGRFSWATTSTEDADGLLPNPTFLLSRVTDVESLDIDFQVDAADCSDIAAEGFFKVTFPGRSGADLPWNPSSLPLVASHEGHTCTYRLFVPMSAVDTLIDALPVHVQGEAPRINPENEYLSEHYLAFTVRARNPQQQGCQWSQHAYVRLREGSVKAGTMEWDESSWNADFDPEP